MELRSYYASTLAGAMALASRELGPEALLIQSQRTSPQWMHLGKYEAVFAGEVISQAPLPPDPKTMPAEPAGRVDFRAILQSAGKSTLNSSPRAIVPNAAPAIACDPGLGRKGFAATVALVGPSGAGKTTTAMKLALRHGTLESRTVRLIAFDPQRVGATRQLQHFADLFSIPFTNCELLEQLEAALATASADLTLIDTPGFSAGQSDEKDLLAACLRPMRQVEVQLVLRVDRKPADNLSAVERFSCFAPTRAILTAIDETSEFADLPALITRANAAVSFLGTGNRLVEDMEPATPQRLSDMVLNGWPKAASAAA